jgi:adenylate cyclase
MRLRHLKRFLFFLLPLAVLTPAVLIHLANPLPLEQLRLKLFDNYQRLQPRAYEPLPVTIVDIDEESLRRLGQWPWSREKLATLTARLSQDGVAAVGWDIVFAEADRTSPALLLPTWKGFLGKDVTKGVTIPDYDAVFAEAINAGNVVMGFVLSDSAFETPKKMFGFVTKGESPTDSLFPYAGAVSSLPVLTDAARGNGALNAIPDSDGLIRKVPLLFRVRDQILPSLAAETLRIAQGASTYVVTSTEAGISSVKIGEYDIPTDRHGHVWVHYTPYQQTRYIPAWEVLTDEFDVTRLEGNIVLIGTSAAGLKDIRATPLDPVTNGVEVHAQALEQMLSGHFLERPDWLETAELFMMVAAGLLVWAVLTFTSPYIGAICTTVILFVACWGSWVGFSKYHMLIDSVSPSLVILMIYLVETLRGYITTERERRQVRHAFSHYMSPALVKKLAEQPDSLKLGGEMKEMTILFCDIRGFTTISEQFDAEGLTRFINSFLTPMTNIILERQGTIDKYIGDCIMAFWNAPLDDADHAMNACRSALAMLEGLKLLNETRERESEESGSRFIPVRIGIGLNTDICCVGNMGSDQRFDYSVLGDGVNLASRLEGQSKYYGMTIVIGEKTYAAVQDFAVMELDVMKVKGKTEAVRIFGLMGDERLAETAKWKAFLHTHQEMLQAYRAAAWEKALDALNHMEVAAASANMEIDGFIALYKERITDYQTTPPPADWDGVYVATSK